MKIFGLNDPLLINVVFCRKCYNGVSILIIDVSGDRDWAFISYHIPRRKIVFTTEIQNVHYCTTYCVYVPFMLIYSIYYKCPSRDQG